MKLKTLHKIFICLIVIKLVVFFLIQPLAGLWNVSADNVEYEYRETYKVNGIADKPDKDAILVSSNTTYQVEYKGVIEYNVWESKLFSVGKNHIYHKFTNYVTIDEVEQLSKEKRKNSSNKTENVIKCKLTLKYIGTYENRKDNLTKKDFGNLYIYKNRDELNDHLQDEILKPDHIIYYKNIRKWKIPVKKQNTNVNSIISKFASTISNAANQVINNTGNYFNNTSSGNNNNNNTNNYNTGTSNNSGTNTNYYNNTNNETQPIVVKPTSTLTFDEKTADACYNSLINSGFYVTKDSSNSITMYKEDVDKVTNLDIKGKGLTNLNGIQVFKNLKILHIGNNNITDLSKVFELSNLEELVLNNNQVQSLNGISRLTKLTKLNANSNPITEMSEISKLTNLKYLYMAHCKLTSFKADLSNLNKLEEIGLEDNLLQTGGIENLAKSANLKRLYLNKNKINDISELTKLKNLEELYVNDNIITSIPKFEKLSKFTIKNNVQGFVTLTNKLDIPDILKEVRNKDSKIYTSEDFEFTNCKLQNNEIIVDSNAQNASIVIKGGNADGAEITIRNQFRTITLNDKVLAERLQQQLGLLELSIKDGKYNLAISNGTLITQKALDLSTPNDSDEKIRDVSGLEAFYNLTYINLRNNEITDLDSLKNLNNLETLDIRYNNLTNLKCVKNLKTLVQLDASNNAITDISDLADLVNLKDLLLSHNNIRNNFSVLSNLKNSLETLSLINNNVSELSDLSELNLNRLYLGYNQISDISPINQQSLLDLDVSNNSLTINVRNESSELPEILQSYIEETGNTNDIECVGCSIENNKIILDEGVNLAKIKILKGKFEDTVITLQNEEALQPTELEVTYDLSGDRSQMIVTIRSNKKLLPLLGWDLTESSTALKKTYRYNVQNQVVTVRDIYGNETSQLIEFTGVQNYTIPDLTVSYSESMKTNKNVKVTISSSVPLHETYSGWELEEDGKSVSQVFNENTNSTYMPADILTESMYNRQRQPYTFNVEVSVIDKKAPNCTVEYSETEKTKGSVRATIWSDEEIELVNVRKYIKTQKIDERGRTQYGIILYYDHNSSDDIIVRDLVYNISNVNVQVNNIDKNLDGLYAKSSDTNLTKNDITLVIGANEKISVRNNESYVVASNIQNSVISDMPLFTLANANQTYNDKVSIQLSERELGVLEASDEANNKDLVLYNSSMIDKHENNITSEINYNEDESVEIILRSTKPIIFTEDLAGWELNDDETELRKTFTQNAKEILNITDYLGNKIQYEVDVNDLICNEYVLYYYPIQGTNKVFVAIDSKSKLKETDGWELSEDKQSLGKVINFNEKEIVTVYDEQDNEKEFEIYYEGELEKEDKTDEDSKKEEDKTVAKEELPNGGKYYITMVIIILILIILTIITLRNYLKHLEKE